LQQLTLGRGAGRNIWGDPVLRRGQLTRPSALQIRVEMTYGPQRGETARHFTEWVGLCAILGYIIGFHPLVF